MYKIVWAVDPFDLSGELRDRVSHIFQSLIEKTSVKIQPIYVFSDADLDHFIETAPSRIPSPRIEDGPVSDELKLHHKEALRAVRLLTSSLHLKEIQAPEVLLQRSSLAEGAMEMLSRYSYSSGSDLILVHSRGRTGLSRLFLGSFAESLLFKSKLPVLVVGPEVEETSSLKTILFPTDFGQNSKMIFRRVVALAQQLKMGLILYHSVPHPVETILQSGVSLLGGGTWLPENYYFSDEIEREATRARRWTRWARHQGIAAEYVVDSFSGAVSEVIVNLAKKKGASWIAMEGQSGTIASALVGSVTRQVIRNAHCPVWVVRASMPMMMSKPEEDLKSKPPAAAAA